jgi:glycerophosphoryl diester phosphodiesterase
MKLSFLRKIGFLFLSIALMQCSKPGNNPTVNPPTELEATFTINVAQITVNSQVIFTGSSTNPENNIVSWTWDFADGSPVETNKNVTHSFLFAGSYLVKLTVKNTAGQNASFSKRVLVKNTAAPNYGNLIGLKQKLVLLYPKVMVAAHRAYQKNFPENSVEAINNAAVNNINIVEIDTRLTLDNELVIMHDATTTRTTNVNFTVAQRTLTELKQLRLLFNGTPSAYTIPTLKESLEAAKGKVYVNIDASFDNSVFYYNKIYNTVAALNMVNMVMIYTESAEVAKGLLEIDSDIIVLLGAGNATDYNNATNMNPKASLWHMASGTLSPNYTNWPNNNGIKLWANAYVNSTNTPPATGNDAVLTNLITNQISLIQTDYPLEIISSLQAQNLWLQ